MSRMNLQSTGSFVPKKFAALSSSGGGPLNPPPKSGNKFAGAGRSNKPAAKKTTGAPKASSNELNSKEKSMLVMLGIEDDPLICVRSQDTKGLGDSIADVRELYQAKQALGKSNRTLFDETKHRDEVDMSRQIRSYPLAASTSPERKSPNPLASIALKPSVSTPKRFVDLTTPASAEAINSAKQRAIDILKQRLAAKQVTPVKGQSLVSADVASSPSTSSPKRPIAESEPSVTPKRLKVSNTTNESVDQNRFAEIMNMKSSHAEFYNQITLDEIFERHKKKENIDEKLLHIMERDVKVVSCKLCHYTAYKQSVLCKQKQHYVKICEVKQKFFECVECEKRVFTWSQYPVENCTNCRSLKGFRRTALVREREGPKLDDEILLLRGEEEKFLNSFASYQKLPTVVD